MGAERFNPVMRFAEALSLSIGFVIKPPIKKSIIEAAAHFVKVYFYKVVRCFVYTLFFGCIS